MTEIYYLMGKNDKSGSLKIPEKTLAILEQYKSHEQKHDLIFPELKLFDNLNNKYDLQRKIAYANKRLNKALAVISEELGLTKKLTMHITRHMFGNLAGEKIPIQMLQKLYRHSSITTTIGYQANAKIYQRRLESNGLSFIFGKFSYLNRIWLTYQIIYASAQ